MTRYPVDVNMNMDMDVRVVGDRGEWGGTWTCQASCFAVVSRVDGVANWVEYIIVCTIQRPTRRSTKSPHGGPLLSTVDHTAHGMGWGGHMNEFSVGARSR